VRGRRGSDPVCRPVRAVQIATLVKSLCVGRSQWSVADSDEMWQSDLHQSPVLLLLLLLLKALP